MTDLKKSALGNINDSADAPEKTFKNQCAVHACNRFDISKSYMDGKINFHITFRQRGVGEVGKYCAIVQRHPLRVAAGDSDGWTLPARRCENRVRWLCGCDAHGYEEIVLIGNAQSMQSPQIGVPSLVWFETMDESSGLAGHALYSSLNGSTHFFRSTSSRNRKPSVVGDFHAAMANKVACKDVERRSKIVNTVPDKWPPIAGWMGDVPAMEDPLRSLKIYLLTNPGRIVVNMGIDSIYEVEQVLFGPLNL